MARIGINGFGRIGRYLVRLMAERNEFPVVINARADNASLAHLFKYDSVHHTFKGTVGHDENGIIINGIAPGATFTPMIARYAHAVDQPYPRHAIGRFIRPEEIAELAAYLMSEWGEIICGHTVVADGGDSAATL